MHMHSKGPPRKFPKPTPPRRATTFPILAPSIEYDPEAAGLLLREVREQYGVPIVALSRWSGVSESMITRIELGSRGIMRDTLEAILTALEPRPEEANLIRLRAGFAPK